MTKRKPPRAKKPTNRAKAKPTAKSGELPATVKGRPDLPAAHVNRPVKGCPCGQCREHRTRNRLARRDELDAAFFTVMFGPMTSRAAKNATAAFKAALGIE